MKTGVLFLSVLAASTLSLAACGGSDGTGLCVKAQECAEKSGEQFSKTECENDLKAEKEKAETANCGSEYSDFASCAESIDLECSDNLGEKLTSECGAEAKALNKCLE